MWRALVLASVAACLLVTAGCGGESPSPTGPGALPGDTSPTPDAAAGPVIQFDRVGYSYGASGEHPSARVRVAFDARGAGWMVARIQSPGRDGAAPRVLAEAIVALTAGHTAVLDLAVPDSVLATAGVGGLEAASEVRDRLGKIVAEARRAL